MNTETKAKLLALQTEIAEHSIQLKQLQTQLGNIIEDEVDEQDEELANWLREQSWDVYGPAVNKVMNFSSDLGDVISDRQLVPKYIYDWGRK